MTHDEKYQLLLTQLVLMFQTAAYQHMGKLKNPFSGALERDLQQAQISIDMLDMLSVKTRGNLSEEEERILTDVIRELKLNYVDEVAKDQARASGTTGATPDKEPPIPS